MTTNNLFICAFLLLVVDYYLITLNYNIESKDF